jgi:hypothetical protein
MIAVDLRGQRFGHLTAVERVAVGTRTVWRCECDCGGTITALTNKLRAGRVRSCGCLRRPHGHRLADENGGRSSEYIIWEGIVQRCTDPSCSAWERYGARGITVCERWRTFADFLSDMGTRPSRAHSIDRIDNDRGYEPGNCRWATATEQANNRSNNHRISYAGETATIAQWSRRTGVPYHLISRRIRAGWPTELVFSRPPQPGWRGAALRRKEAANAV